MNTLNIPFIFGKKNIKINIKSNYLDIFLFFMGKIDFLCVNKYIIPINHNNKLNYNIVNIQNYKIDKNIEYSDDIFSKIIITDKKKEFNTKPLVIYLEQNNIEINFNFNSKNQNIVNQLLISFDIFKKTFDGKNYSLIENDKMFIEEYNTIKDYNIDNISLLKLLENSIFKNNSNIAIKFKDFI